MRGLPALARALKCNVTTVRRWARKKSWTFPGPDYIVADVVRWTKNNVSPRRNMAKSWANNGQASDGALVGLDDLHLATASREELERYAKYEKAQQARDERRRAGEAWIEQAVFGEALVSLGEMMRRELLDFGRSFEARFPDVQGELLPGIRGILNRIADRIAAERSKQKS